MHQPSAVDPSLLASLTGALPVLRALAGGATLTETAQRLGMSQPALSRSLNRWESELSLPLTARAGRGITLTAEGRALADAAERALDIMETTLEEVLTRRDERPVRLGALRSISGRIAPLIADAETSVNLSVSEGSAGELLAKVEKGELDAAIIGPRPPGADFSWTFLTNQPFHLTIPVGHRVEGQDAVLLSEVASEAFVAMEARYTTRHFADELCKEAGFTPKIAVESDNSHTLRSFVAAGLGLCILPKMMAEAPGVSSAPIIRPNGELATREIGMVRAPRRQLPPHVRRTLHHIVAQANRVH